MHIFLAGATGVVGRRIIPLLTAQGHRVTGLLRDGSKIDELRHLGAASAIADALDHDGVVSAIARAKPDVVMHQLTDLSAGSSAANAALRIRGTRNLMDAVHASGVPRVIAQSISWAYTRGATIAVESTPLDTEAPEPRKTTVVAVAALESAVAEADEWVVLRYGTLYGAGTWYSATGSVADDARAGRLSLGDDVTSFLHVHDAAAAAVAALEWTSGVVNIVDDEPARASQWLPVFCRAVDAPEPVERQTAERHPWMRGASNRRARDLGWSPAVSTWREGFQTFSTSENPASTRSLPRRDV
jgi:nucleoside-diphosphate-sugar epimerase